MTAAAIVTLPALSTAETLDEAIETGLQTNPVIAARREQAAAAHQAIAIASAGYFPKLTLTGSATISTQPVTGGWASASVPIGNSALNQRALGYGASLEQPLFDGLRTFNTVAEAQDNAAAEDDELAALSQEVRLDVTKAYMGVLTGRMTVLLRHKASALLKADLTAAMAQANRGEATSTDIDQIRVRLADAGNAQAAAEAELAAQEASFAQAVGDMPGALVFPSVPVAMLPPSLGAAVDLSQRHSLGVSAAVSREQAARHAVDKTLADGLPQASLQGSYSHNYDGPPASADYSGAQVSVQVVMPISLGGETLAKLAQARSVLRQRSQELAAKRREILTRLRSAWASFHAAKLQSASSQDAVTASERALAGLRKQRKAGDKTTLDVLNAEHDVVEIKIQALRWRSNAVLSAYTILVVAGDAGAAATTSEHIAR